MQNVLEVMLGTCVLCNTVVLNVLSVTVYSVLYRLLSSCLLKAVELANSRHAQ